MQYRHDATSFEQINIIFRSFKNQRHLDERPEGRSRLFSSSTWGCNEICFVCKKYCMYDLGHPGSHRCPDQHTW